MPLRNSALASFSYEHNYDVKTVRYARGKMRYRSGSRGVHDILTVLRFVVERSEGGGIVSRALVDQLIGNGVPPTAVRSIRPVIRLTNRSVKKKTS